MATVLYRKNGGEVLMVSHKNREFREMDPRFYGILEDPPAPDGVELREIIRVSPGREVLGEARQLGFAKVMVAGVMRNATQPEIDAWPAIEQAEQDTIDVEDAQRMAEADPIFRRALLAAVKLLIKHEINPLREAAGLQPRIYTPAQMKTALRNEISRND